MKFPIWLPNGLTALRIFLVIPIAYWLWMERIGWAFLLLFLAGATDLLDGFLAREFHLQTVLGSWLDPAADKLLITTVLIILTLRGDVPGWFFGITLFRDIGLAIGTFSLLAAGIGFRIDPFLSGKFATVGQNVALLLAMVRHLVAIPSGALQAMFVVSATVTLISTIAYGRELGRILRTF